MSEEKRLVVEVRGAEKVGEAVLVATKSTVDALSAFLSRICLPVAKEFGLLLKDKVHAWRAENSQRTIARAEQIAAEQGVSQTAHAHPRIVSEVLEESSWIDDHVVQDMWAGLLSSALTESGDDDSNLLFTNLLSQVTKVQARVLKYACENAGKVKYPNGLVVGFPGLQVAFEELVQIAEESDLQRLDRELDHLTAIGLLTRDNSGFQYDHLNALLHPTALALQLFVRSQGSRKSPAQFFGLDDAHPRPAEQGTPEQTTGETQPAEQPVKS